MKKSNILSLAFLMLLAGLSACQSHDEVAPVREIEVSLDESRSITEQNNFGFKLLSKLNNDENCVISPLSLSMGLSMVANGADGETRAEILEALGVDDIEQLNAINTKLLNALPKVDPNKVEISFGNALFADPSLNVFDSFKSTLRSSYQAEVVDTDLPSDKIREKVNAFVSKKTRGHITEALPELPGDVSMALVDALYFKGAWAKAFDKAKTTKEKFNNLDGSVSEVDMMYLDRTGFETTAIVDELNAVVGVCLEYGNSAYSMTILEPTISYHSFDQYFEKLIDGTYFKKFRFDHHIRVPKFIVETKMEFSEILNAAGVRKTFNADEADFSNLSPLPGISIDNVFHAAKLEVNEDGGEGAAASEYDSGASGPYPHLYVVENPFIFFITEKSSGAVVFAGKVTKL